MRGFDWVRTAVGRAKEKGFEFLVWHFSQGSRPDRLQRRIFRLKRKYKFLARLLHAVIPPPKDKCAHCWNDFSNPHRLTKNIITLELFLEKRETSAKIVRIETWFAGSPIDRGRFRRIEARGRILSRFSLRLCKRCRLMRPRFVRLHIGLDTRTCLLGAGTDLQNSVTGFEYIWEDTNGREYTRHFLPENPPPSGN